MLKFIPGEVYAALSFRKGGSPDFDRLSTFFLPEAVFINNKGEAPVVRVLGDYITMMETAVSSGQLLSLRETEIEQTCQIFGKVAQITSAYELLFDTPDGMRTRYGVNLFQMVCIKDQWQISAMCWDDRPDQTLLSSISRNARLFRN